MVLKELNILQIPIDKFDKVITKCIELVQIKLKTNLFNNINDSKWSVFDMMVSGFSNLCLNISNFYNKKGLFMPTNISMLLFLFGDCREHALLLIYLLNIYLYENKDKTYLIVPIYTSGGVNIDNKFFDLKYEHTFPIVINLKTKNIFSIDALYHKTKIVKFPDVENMNKKIKLFDKDIFISGKYLNNKYKNKDYLIKLINWFSEIKCEYSNNKLLNENFFVYGINFELPDIKYVFDKCFNDNIVNNLLNSKLCRNKSFIHPKC